MDFGLPRLPDCWIARLPDCAIVVCTCAVACQLVVVVVLLVVKKKM